MKPSTLLNLIIRPTLAELARYDTKPGLASRAAEVMLVAIAIQESELEHRRQIRGPARSFWQIEPPTAIDTLNRYRAAEGFCLDIRCEMNDLVDSAIDMYYLLRYNDSAACAIARGILRLNKDPLPDVGDEIEAWNYYLDSWRPGKPRPDSWAGAYQTAMGVTAPRWLQNAWGGQ